MAFVDYLRANVTKENFNLLFKSLVIGIAGIIFTGLAVLTLSGKVPFMFLLDFLLLLLTFLLLPQVWLTVLFSCSYSRLPRGLVDSTPC